MSLPKVEGSEPVSRPNPKNSDSLSIRTLLPIVGTRDLNWLQGSTLLITSNGVSNLTTTTDLGTLVGAAQTALQSHASVCVRRVRAVFSLGAALSQSCAVSVIAGWMPSALPVPPDANQLLLGFSQSYRMLLGNAGVGSSSTQAYEISLNLGEENEDGIPVGANRMTSQLAPSGLIGNVSPPKLRTFISVDGVPPTIPINDLGISAVAYYEYLPSKYLGL